MSDTLSTYATIPLDELFDELLKSSPAPQKMAPKNGISILVVDDEPIVQKFITSLLNNEGYDVEMASDGAEALMSIGGKTFDAILLDVNMPNVDGFQFMNIVKQKGIKTPVIILSGDEEKDIAEKSMKLGASGYLVKPVNGRAMLEKLKGLLKNGE
jgi:CheY-like chemotaxis protein